MTPAARVSAAIEVLDEILAGSAPEKALTGWGRAHRFAGSKDRAAIRDHVFQALRCRTSYGWLGGAQTGRGIMIGAMQDAGLIDQIFTGEGHAPAPLTADEGQGDLTIADRAIRFDMPDWLLPHFDRALGDNTDQVLTTLQSRAGVFLRVNAARATLPEALEVLARDGIPAIAVPNVSSALQVVDNERKISSSTAYLEGLVELQDPSSQLAIERLSLTPGTRVLDMCAGGGGKALAMAAMGAKVTAHDIDACRMVDLHPRATRAGAGIDIIATADLQHAEQFDLVLCDAPCSGSGTWRRAPMAKWDLTPERLMELTQMQDDVLTQAGPLVRTGGCLAYATCSVFRDENQNRIDAYLEKNNQFQLIDDMSIMPHTHGDGFYLAVLKRR